MRVGIAARNPDKPVLQRLETTHGVRRYACDASEPAAVESLFQNVVRDLGAPTLVVHNIDGRVSGIFRKGITEADPAMVLDTLRNSAFSAFLVGQQAARLMRDNKINANGAKGTIIFTNASAAIKRCFAMACHAKSGLAESAARELMPQGIHVASVPIDAAIGWTQEDGTRAHRLAGTTVDDNMADPDRIAETYLQLHRQHDWLTLKRSPISSRVSACCIRYRRARSGTAARSSCSWHWGFVYLRPKAASQRSRLMRGRTSLPRQAASRSNGLRRSMGCGSQLLCLVE
jgi:NAD(P)-dependent dehydrogenase (short-subunit alcohol dehydrogenase family)